MDRLSHLVLGLVRVRILPESLLAITMVTGVFYLFTYVPKHAKAGEPVIALAHYFLTYAPIDSVNQPAYVMPDSVQAWDTPAVIRTQVAILPSGEQVQALGHFRDWTHVRLRDGQEAWVSDDGLMSAATHEAEERLCDLISELPPQADGHAIDVDNVHIEPSRQAAVVAEVTPEETLEIFGRRMVRRPPQEFGPYTPADPKAGPWEAWYLVQRGPRAGWILGHRVQLDIPRSLSAYSQETNLVAWLVLDTVRDDGHRVPQYVVADRVGTQMCDFTGIRVLTWWKRKQTYAVAYREDELEGFFPILVSHQGSVPYFRLRVLANGGARSQKVYGLFETMTRLIGIAGSWQSDAVPEPAPVHARIREVAFAGG